MLDSVLLGVSLVGVSEANPQGLGGRGRCGVKGWGGWGGWVGDGGGGGWVGGWPPARPRICFKMIAARLLQGCCKNAARLLQECCKACFQACCNLQEWSKVAARLAGQLLEFSCSF